MGDGARQLRDLLRQAGVAAAPGAHDAFTARIVEKAGHKAVYLGGNAMALSLAKGQPFITLTETAQIAMHVARAVDVPVLVDAGAGFGDPPHLLVAVQELEGTGAGGLHIDDQPYPKQAGYHRGRGKLVDAAAMAERLRVAVKARWNPDFVIVARTDALRVTKSLDDTILRCRSYAEAGADALMVLDLGPEQAAAVKEACPGVPLIWIGGVRPPIPTLAELEQADFSLACYPFNGIAEMTARLGDLWGNLGRTGAIEQPADTLARAGKETLDLVRMQTFWDIEDRSGPGGEDGTA